MFAKASQFYIIIAQCVLDCQYVPVRKQERSVSKTPRRGYFVLEFLLLEAAVSKHLQRDG